MERTKTTASGRISHKTGNEGPRHDPYGYDEYTCERKGNKAVLHMGVGTWLKVNGKPTVLDNPSETMLVGAFEYFCGISLNTFERVIRRPWPCICGTRQQPEQKYGYPGETITVCSKCGQTLGYAFDRESIC